MTLSEEKDGNVFVVGLKGKIDLAGTDLLVKRITEILEGGDRYLLLDFTGVTYINSAGLCALILVGSAWRGPAASLFWRK